MAKDRDQALQRLQNYMDAEEEETLRSAHVYNSDTSDVDLDRYSQEVCQPPRKRSCLGVLILLLLAATAVFLYLAWGGKLPWN